MFNPETFSKEWRQENPDYDKLVELLLDDEAKQIIIEKKLYNQQYNREYKMGHQQKPITKSKRKEYNQRPKAKDRRKEYSQRPEVKLKKEEYQREYKQKSEYKSQQKEYYQRPEIKDKRKKYKKEHSQKPEIKAKSNKRRRDKRKTDLNYKMKCILRCRINDALKHNWKADRIMELLGCSIEYLKNYLEVQFDDEMSWSNHGKGGDKWNIDHIRPCASFDLTKEEEQRKCFNFQNLQPLWQSDNEAKGAKIL